jgi:hypothetical protein
MWRLPPVVSKKKTLRRTPPSGCFTKLHSTRRDPHRLPETKPRPRPEFLATSVPHRCAPPRWAARTWFSNRPARAAATRRTSTARGASTPRSAAPVASPWRAPGPAASFVLHSSPSLFGYGSVPPPAGLLCVPAI